MPRLWESRREKRVAFVVGNGAYKYGDSLDAPANDATMVALTLAKLGFISHPLINVNGRKIVESFEKFHRQIQGADVAVIYYSGHGIQIDGTNYILSVEANIESDDFMTELVSIQDLTARVAETAKTTLVFLDACRNNPFESSLRSQNPHDVQTKGLTPTAAKRVGAGLAYYSASAQQLVGQTFLAFAAAPGKIAWEGGGSLSIFTESLVKNMETMELSINHLMLIVSRHVQEETGGQQEPWTSSSLLTPFYFNAGPLLWISANILGIAALLTSILSLCLVVVDRPGEIYVVVSAASMLGTLLIFLSGLSRAYGFMRGKSAPDRRYNWWRALTGGYLGGVIAAPVIALSYFFLEQKNTDTLGRLQSEITVAAIITAVLLAISYDIARNPQWLSSGLAKRPRAWHMIGSILGGLTIGVIVGPPITWYFGSQDRPPISPEALLPGSLTGTAAIVFSIVSYFFEGSSYRKLAKNALLSAGATVGVAFISAFGFYIFADDFTALVSRYLVGNDLGNLVRAGLTFGPLVGAILGSTIGVALLLLGDD